MAADIISAREKENSVVDYRIVPDKTALLLFDMVNDCVAPGAPFENPEIRKVLIPKLKRLMNVCRSRGIPVIYACHAFSWDGSNWGVLSEVFPQIAEKKYLMKGTPGAQVYDEIKPQEGDIVIEKCRYSAFQGTQLDIILKTKGRDTLIVTGALTQGGCDATAKDATVRDYRVIFPSDGNLATDVPDVGWGSISKDIVQKVELSILTQYYAKVMTIDELIKKLK